MLDQVVYNTGWGIIPKSVMFDTELTIEAKAIFAYLATYAGNGETAFPGVQLMLSHLQISESRYYKHMKLLKEKGYVEVTQVKGEGNKFSHNLYRLNPYPQIESTGNGSMGNEGTKKNNFNKNNNINNICPSKEEARNKTPKNKKTMPEEDKDKIWKMYPRKEGKKKAYQYMDRLTKEGYTVEQIELAVKRYKSILEAKETEKQYIKMGSGFFNEKIYDFLESEEGIAKPSDEYNYTNKGEGEFTDFDFSDELARQLNPKNKL